MSGLIGWTPLRISDAGRMLPTGRFGTGEGEAKALIRGLLRPETRSTRAYAASMDEKGAPIGAAILTVADSEARRAVMRILPAGGLDTALFTDFIRSFCDFAFFRLGLHRVELPIEAGEEVMAEAALAAGMCEEGLLKNAIYRDGRHRTARSFAMLRPQSRFLAYGFVAFAKGLVAVRGFADAVDQVEFLRYGVIPDDDFLKESMACQGFLGDDGKVRPTTQKIPAEALSLPAEVEKACGQIREYFDHRRTTFDIALDFSARTSAFQQNVWQILRRIGYGHVWTYEDVAAELVDGPREEARKMARAIGSACASNPIALIVPCHRVIGKDGKLTGFSGGVDIKEYLLEHELVLPDANRVAGGGNP